jgi:hypothetical protein
MDPTSAPATPLPLGAQRSWSACGWRWLAAAAVV